MGSPRSSKRVALPQYREDQWNRWLETVDDPQVFEPGFDRWQAGARAMAGRLERGGLEVIWIELDPDRITEWCKSRNYPNVNEKRFQFAAEQIGNVRIH